MVTVKKANTTLFIILMLIFGKASAGSVTARITPAVVEQGQAVTLMISVDSNSLATPDLSVLNKDFKIVKKTNSSSIHQVNGTTLIKKNWVIRLLPLKQGKLRIPVIKVGYDRTPPLTLTVKPKVTRLVIEDTAGTGSDNATSTISSKDDKQNKKAQEAVLDKPDKTGDEKRGDDLFIKVEADISETYVQGQIVITQKIFHAIPLKEANLSVPELEPVTEVQQDKPASQAAVKDEHVKDEHKGRGRNTLATLIADVIPLSQSAPYYWYFNGRRYHVIERSYALFPKHSGHYRLRAATLTGVTTSASKTQMTGAQTGRKSGSTDSREVTRKVVAHAPTLSLTVRPQRTTAENEAWLPAKNITLYAKRLNPEQVATQGEPLDFQIGMIADGLRAEQLPDIKLELPANVKTYAEPAILDNTITLLGVTGVWSQKVTLIPQFAGNVIIPEFRLPWWNVTTDHREVATLPEKVLVITAKSKTNANGNNELKGAGEKGAVEKANAGAQPLANGQRGQRQSSAATSALSILVRWKNAWLVALLALLAASAGFLLYRYMYSNKRFADNTFKKEQEGEILDKLKQACETNNAQQVARLLPLWAAEIGGIYPPTLEAIAQAENALLEDEIAALSQALYGRDTNTWQGSQLWEKLKKYPATAAEQPGQGNPSEIHLKKMYPL